MGLLAAWKTWDITSADTRGVTWCLEPARLTVRRVDAAQRGRGSPNQGLNRGNSRGSKTRSQIEVSFSFR